MADIGRRDKPYRRSLSWFAGWVRRVEPYRRKLSLPNPTQPNPTQPNLTFGNLAVDRYQVALLHMQYYYKLSGILCRLGASVPDKKKLIVIFK